MKRQEMPYTTFSGRNVLLVGHKLHSGRALTDRLRRCGFRCHFADNMRAASDLLSSQPVDVGEFMAADGGDAEEVIAQFAKAGIDYEHLPPISSAKPLSHL